MSQSLNVSVSRRRSVRDSMYPYLNFKKCLRNSGQKSEFGRSVHTGALSGEHDAPLLGSLNNASLTRYLDDIF